MERSESRIQVFTWLIVAVTLFIGLSLHSVAQKQTSTLSGRVVDVEGNPVAKSPVFVSPVEMFGGVHFTLGFRLMVTLICNAHSQILMDVFPSQKSLQVLYTLVHSHRI